MHILVTAVLLNLFALLTIMIRPKLFGVKLYTPMIWNFKLSVFPFLVLMVNIVIFFITRYISTYVKELWMTRLSDGLFIIGLVIWLLLLPNSGYLVTELNLNHRAQDDKPVPIWYDIVSILSFALSGIINLLVNIFMIQMIYIIIVDPISYRHIDRLFIHGSTVLLLTLVSVGIYVGREIRLNSWDVVHPFRMIKKIYKHFRTPGSFRNFFLFIIFHVSLFLIIYYTFNFQGAFSY